LPRDAHAARRDGGNCVKTFVHDRIEAIAGAIALGEAGEDERREYREHIASCAACLNALGGEREIERVASAVSAARDEEVWQPDVGDVVATRMRRRSQRLRWTLSIFGAALAASFGMHAIFAASIPRLSSAAAAPVVTNAPKPVAALAAAPQRRMIVTHNVVQIARAPMPVAAAPALPAAQKPRQLVAITVHPQDAAPPAHKANVPVWRRDGTSWRTVAKTTTTSVTETAPQTLTHSAESLQVSGNYATREVAPVGGETAINPQPPMIAYDEGAEGTTVFEVLVDEHGLPTKCVITKSAGYPVLDDAVCKAAMNVRYLPKVSDGRAVPGTYHDAFTFHMSDQSSTIQQQIPSSAPGIRPPRATPPVPTHGLSSDDDGI
jgi:TonB family protein